MNELALDFINSSLSNNLPPSNPLLRPDWAGLAFDRNRYGDFAPDDVWTAWLVADTDGSRLSDILQIIPEDPRRQGRAGSAQVVSSLSALRTYWAADSNFMFDHYVIPASHKWIVRLDQDVTLFAGERCFVNAVVDKLGGYDNVMSQMEEDFSPGESDAAGLRRYLQTLLPKP